MSRGTGLGAGGGAGRARCGACAWGPTRAAVALARGAGPPSRRRTRTPGTGERGHLGGRSQTGRRRSGRGGRRAGGWGRREGRQAGAALGRLWIGQRTGQDGAGQPSWGRAGRDWTDCLIIKPTGEVPRDGTTSELACRVGHAP